MYEIELVLENGGYSYIGSGKYQIKKGCVICAKPGQIRHTDLPLEKFYTLADPCELKTAFRALIAANVLPN